MRESLSQKASRNLNLLSGRSRVAVLGDNDIYALDEGGPRQSSYIDPFDVDPFDDILSGKESPHPRDVLGFDMSSVTPYLSAFASGFGGGSGGGQNQQAQQQQAALQAQMERDRLQREADRAAASSRTAWVIAGIAGIGVLGTLIYLVARK